MIHHLFGVKMMKSLIQALLLTITKTLLTRKSDIIKFNYGVFKDIKCSIRRINIMHSISMSTAIARSVVHIISMIMMFILILIPVIANESSSSSALSPPDSPASLPQKEGEKEYYQVHLNLEEDYGNWNPPPGSGGASPAPVPHANLFHSHVPFSGTAPTP